MNFSIVLILLGLGSVGARYFSPPEDMDESQLMYLADLEESKVMSSRDEEEEEEDIPGPPLTRKDLVYAALLAAREAPAVDPILLAGRFEGDIMNVFPSDLEGRNAIVDMTERWEDAKIPYEISSKFDKKQRSIIADAMEQYHKKTCLKFIAREKQEDYLYISPGDGCSSSVGRMEGKQELILGEGCVHKGIVMHELMHAIGFWHEQSRPDRDDHVTVNWKNIQDGLEYNFKKYDQGEVGTLGIGYDIDSIMHYGPYSFAKDIKVPTIVSKGSKKTQMGQRDGFSSTDIKKINELYECKKYKQ